MIRKRKRNLHEVSAAVNLQVAGAELEGHCQGIGSDLFFMQKKGWAEMAKKKFYAVAVGNNPGIFTTWAEAEAQVKGVGGARYKSFPSKQEAEKWLADGGQYVSSERKKTSASKRAETKTNPAGDEIILYTDGGALNNPGPGGWGVVRFEGDEQSEISGGFRKTTNNRMELFACIKALESVAGTAKKIVLYTDSSYVVNGFSKGWAKAWQKNGWRKSDGQRAKNQDLWEQLLASTASLQVNFNWVKGHAGNEFNERCDQLAVGAARGGPTAIDKFYESEQANS